jgi:hypothetical protein
MTGMRGAYPGGPKREGSDPSAPGDQAPRPHRLETVEEIEERRGRASLFLTQQRRARRVWVGLLVALLVAGGTGFVLGIRAHRTSEEMAAARNAPKPAGAFDPSFETNRMLQQLWKMEENEYGVRPPGGGP